MMDRLIKRFGFGILIVLMLIVSACGGSGGGGLGGLSTTNNTDMTADQATAFAQSVTRISTNSMKSPAFTGNALSAGTSQLRSISCNQAGCQLNQPISYTLTCTAGGNMKASGNITGSMSNTGTGIIQLQIPITISDWGCEPPAIINGDPYISITGTFSYVNGAPGTQQHISVSGGFKSATQSCQIQLGTDFNPNGGGHTSGTCCGHSIDFTF
jgi:hypothetical protein